MSPAEDGLRRALVEGGVALLPTDTVYGLAAWLDSLPGVAALYELKGRPRERPSQVLLYSRPLLDEALGYLEPPTRRAAAALLPGPATCLVPDPQRRYVAAAGAEAGSVGLRAPRVDGPLARLDLPLVATSANLPGGPDPAAVADVPEALREGCAAVVDAGRLAGTASAVVDLRAVAGGGPARLLREGPDPAALARALAEAGCTLARGHDDPGEAPA
ncbi:MAG TPA: Sua5/YciO/YrdC/YwlC family protein [Miltoncostaeaceae bacterium]|nr:Sua5/YciO/YrdC/YwlC family protein [Miltoncostaeaceae bacterium]